VLGAWRACWDDLVHLFVMEETTPVSLDAKRQSHDTPVRRLDLAALLCEGGELLIGERAQEPLEGLAHVGGLVSS